VPSQGELPVACAKAGTSKEETDSQYFVIPSEFNCENAGRIDRRGETLGVPRHRGDGLWAMRGVFCSRHMTPIRLGVQLEL
jgi:hypothetical protein